MKMDLSELTSEEVRGMLKAYADDPLNDDELRLVLETDSRGGIKNSTFNRNEILLFDSLFRDRLRYDCFLRSAVLPREMPKPWTRRRSSAKLDDTDLALIRTAVYERYGIEMSPGDLESALKVVCEHRCYHPVLELLESLKWDGTPRIAYALKRYLGAEVSDYNTACLRTHMMAAIRRLYAPGEKYDYMLCLTGEQGIGKSSFFRFLALRPEWFTDNLGSLSDEHLPSRLMGHWFCELPEMSEAYSARSLEELKSFVTRQVDNYREPYGRKPADIPRQCVFCGSSNSSQFIPFDRTGARRFLPVQVGVTAPEAGILTDEEETKAYFEQMWAEAMEYYRSHEVRLIMPPELMKQTADMQEQYMPEDTTLGLISGWLARENKKRTCLKEVWVECLSHDLKDDFPRRASLELADCLQKLGWSSGTPHSFGIYGDQRVWTGPKNYSLITAPDPEFPF